MHTFDYHRPASVDEAARLLKEGAKLLAGGQTLLPVMKQRLTDPDTIVDLSGIPDLDRITREGDTLVIGAMTTHGAVETSDTVRQAIPALARLAEDIGDAQVRHRGTIGGSLANNDPAADYPAVLMALDGRVRTNTREMSAEDFFAGLFTTALEENEIITEVVLPIPKRFGYCKFRNPASRFALVGVAVAETGDGVRVAVTGAGADGVFRAETLEQALSGNFSGSALDGVKADTSNLMSDLHADAEYRAHLITVLAKRAVTAAG